ncbi:MAG: D-alanyl-D-alanine carboxypeptidase [Oscillospiraceae bacterium]|nr:D-alanyl-D-alanine carboxypeptidase [Oscillospiraceae bacterium]
MKKCVFVWLLAVLLSATIPLHAHAAAEISAEAAIVYEPVTGTVLYEKRADEPMLVASTTKIMTAMVVIENCDLEEKVDITRAHASTEGSSMYLRPGGEYTVEQLLYGLMLASGNDAAAALAEHTAGSMEAFAELMNSKCRQLGLENTHFVNSHGLDAEEHYSSARDLALITAAAMKSEVFREIFSTAHYNVGGVDYYNHNKLLSSCPGCIGGKTGYTEKAGRILVSCVERDGMRLICVTISDPRDWEDHEALYEKCFGEYSFIPVFEDIAEMDLISGVESAAALGCSKSGFIVSKTEDTRMRIHLPAFKFAPVCAGQIAGTAEIVQNEKVVDSAEIFFLCSVARDESAKAGLLDCLRNALTKKK